MSENGNLDAARRDAQGLAAYFEKRLNGGGARKIGFALLYFETDQPITTEINYISNCGRADMLAALKAVVARWEGQPEAVGHG